MALLDLLARLLPAARRALDQQLAQQIEAALQLHEAGDSDAALALCQQWLVQRPAHHEALHLSGVIRLQQGNVTGALQLLRRACALRPQRALYRFNLGNALVQSDDHVAAERAFRAATRADPTHFGAQYNLGMAIRTNHDVEAAIPALQQALRLQPEHPECALQLAFALLQSGAKSRAAATLDQAVQLFEQHWQAAPDPVAARFGLGEAYAERRLTDKAVAIFQALLQEDTVPLNTRAHLANCYLSLGEIEKANHEYDELLKSFPDWPYFWSSRLANLNYLSLSDPQELTRWHAQWSKRVTPDHRNRLRPGQGKATGRRIRVGYSSADFHRHPVAYIFNLVLGCHDRLQFEVFCYNSSSHPDSMTALLRSHTEHWVDVVELDDAAFAERVLQDELDILIDLSGHTSSGRIHAMQPRIAAVQASWLGYFSTTGLPAMDYLISDPVTSPPGSDSLYTEQVLRMPHSRFVFVAPDYMPAVNALPSQHARHSQQPQPFTFGSLNYMGKVTPAVLDTWARVLHQVPGSRLLLRTFALGQPSGHARIQHAFQERGIDPARLMLLPNVSGEEAMYSYHQIDLALDPFPFTGGMTSFEALWMGVPVVTLPGESMVSRQTLALLTCLGPDMLEFVANSTDDYVARCVHWAQQPQTLQQLRQSLRERVLESPLTDYPEFTRALEDLYRQMLQQQAN